MKTASGLSSAIGVKRLMLLVVLMAGVPAASAQTTGPAGGTAAAQDLKEVPLTEVSFPRQISTTAGTLVIHTPQIESWPDFRHLQARSAIQVTLSGEATPRLGTMLFEGATRTDIAQRVVGIFDLKVTSVSFPDADPATLTKLTDFVKSTVKPGPKKLPLDLVLTYVAKDLAPPGDPGLSMAPPRIFYSTRPAVLMILDGPVVKVPIKNTNLSYAANTNWDLFWHGAENRWFLLNGRQWLLSGDQALSGWKKAKKLSEDFWHLPSDANWADVRAAVPPQEQKGKVPAIFVSETPAELIVMDGRPDWVQIEGLQLRYAANTQSDLFRLDDSYFYLVAGRWFSTTDLEKGPWLSISVPPPVFAGIPKNHAKARVRVAVAGTDEARLAALEAAIPRTAQLKKDSAAALTVTYTGEPSFEAIPTTDLWRAVNSPNDVIRSGDTYYLCYNAVWYVSTSPQGPWSVASKVPDEMYTIPPSSPAYHVTHVRIYASDDDTVTTGYTGGYYNVYSTGTTVVYGTGFYYSPYVWYDDYYPYYYYYPVSYGRGTAYNPITGVYSAAEAVYGPYGGAGRAAAYNPETGTYARGRAVWDDDEIAGSAIGYNPRTGTGVATNRYRSDDSYWGETMVRRNDEWVYTQSDWQDGSGTTDFTTSRGTSGTSERQVSNGQMTGTGTVTRGDQTFSTEMARTDQGVARRVTGEGGESVTFGREAGSDTLYAGKDGQVYRRTDGAWQKYDGGEWQSVASERTGASERTRTEAAPRSSGDRSREQQSLDRSRRQELDRAHDARRSGMDRFSQRRGGYGGMRGGRGGGGRRR